MRRRPGKTARTPTAVRVDSVGVATRPRRKVFARICTRRITHLVVIRIHSRKSIPIVVPVRQAEITDECVVSASSNANDLERWLAMTALSYRTYEPFDSVLPAVFEP